MPCSSSTTPVLLSFLGLFCLALLPRVTGIDYGYFHGDERVNLAAKVLSGGLIPTEHYYPPLMNYLNAVAFAALFCVGFVLQFWDNLDWFRAQYFEDPTPFYIAARAVTAISGALLAPLFYLILRALDIALGVTVVLAASFKHSAVFLIAPMMLVHAVSLAFATSVGAMLRSAGIALGTAVLLWPVLNIGIVLDLQNFLEYQRIQSVMSVRDDGLGPALAMMASQPWTWS